MKKLNWRRTHPSRAAVASHAMLKDVHGTTQKISVWSWHFLIDLKGNFGSLVFISSTYRQMSEFFWIKHCWGLYEQSDIVNSVGLDDCTTE